ncbi:MAG TPA: M20/M25/M40 family metallo-hydrolase [Thermoanaerobaculia bacterium]|jgi:acetylornithine deacetylase/succinyl-diaminopimelate desuccinylase-like protein|nr:M20/M25/M40 family metallo-hydrolase [Thermoanaerobaculia bacterium]
MTAATLERDELARFADREQDRYESLLTELVETPTVSSEPSHRGDIDAGVELARRILKDFGARVTVAKTKGNPVVHGIFPAPRRGAPAVTVYNHIDVQPASRETEPWDTDPFRLVRKDGRYYGRGATDDKGPALCALFGALAVREADVPIEIRFLWEFEEEIGSPNFEEGLRTLGREAATDSILVGDGLWLDSGHPASTSGLRGMQAFQFVLETGKAETHSGTTGGAARNPIGELMQLVSEIYDARTGRVKIPGFSDDVESPSRKELEEFRRSGFSVATFKKDFGFKSLRSKDALDVLKRIWALPTFEVHGVTGGYTGNGVKMIIPHRAEVKASCRLVPNQKPKKVARLVRDFVKRKNPDVTVIVGGSASPFRGETTGPYAEALKRAMRFAFGKPAAFIRGGGSIGAVVTMKRVLQCPIAFLDVSLPEHGYHAPNEHFDWRQASGGIAAYAKYFEELA